MILYANEWPCHGSKLTSKKTSRCRIRSFVLITSDLLSVLGIQIVFR